MNARHVKPKAPAAKVALIPAAGYIRMSTRRQEDSPDRQRAEIKALAARLGYSVIVWYEDHGKTGTESSKRTNFQQMLKDAAASNRRFDAILVHEQSRFSRERIVDVFQHWKAIDEAGVILVTTARGALDFNDTASVLSSVIDAMSARDESAKIAERCVGGLRLAVARGQRLGAVPFGYDRLFVDQSGKELMRVSFRQSQAKPKGFISKLVPSNEPGAVAIVQRIFKEFNAGATIRGISMRLNEQPIKPRCAKVWTRNAVQVILLNRVYCGDYRRGFRPRGQFSTVVSGVETVEQMHEGLVTVAAFEKAQRLLAAKHKPRGAVVEGRNILAGTGRCGHCGGRLYMQLSGKGQPNRYQCSSRSTIGNADFCPYPSIYQSELDSAVMRVVQEALSGDKSALARAQARKTKGTDDPTAGHRTKLADLQAKIRKAAGNVALADDAETVRAINTMIAEWRKEVAELEGKIASVQEQQVAIPEATKSLSALLARFANLPDKLDQLKGKDRAQLALNLKMTIKEVRIGYEKEGNNRWPRVFAEIEFLPGVLPANCDPVVRLNHEQLKPERRYSPATRAVQENYPRIVTMAELLKLEPLQAFGRNARYLGIRRELATAAIWGLVEILSPSEFRATPKR